jgi:hypothetical protein
MIHSVIFL